MEEGLGATLFDRSGRRVTLTDAGDVYARYAHRALQDLEEGRRAIHDVQDLSRCVADCDYAYLYHVFAWTFNQSVSYSLSEPHAKREGDVTGADGKANYSMMSLMWVLLLKMYSLPISIHKPC
ncbi:hypothetical protein [Psychrobacter sp. WY6]|uniref:hypothetical protein n=1 Tax=Psychrobacter sp. WY6 TaxID=2708350 RepID=UPI0032E7F753